MRAYLIGLLVVGGLTLLALAGLYAVRGRVKLQDLQEYHEVAGFKYAVVGVCYAVVLAFICLTVWEQFRFAESVTEDEAGDVRLVFRLSEVWPGADGYEVRAAAVSYVRSVAEEEWAAMQRGEASPHTRRELDRLWAGIRALELRTERERETYAAILGQMDDLSLQRGKRLLASRRAVHPVLWTVLLAGGAITIAFTYFFGLKNRRAQAVMTCLLAATIGLNLWLIVAFQHPFRGDVSVSREAFQETLAQMERLR